MPIKNQKASLSPTVGFTFHGWDRGNDLIKALYKDRVG